MKSNEYIKMCPQCGKEILFSRKDATNKSWRNVMESSI